MRSGSGQAIDTWCTTTAIAQRYEWVKQSVCLHLLRCFAHDLPMPLDVQKPLHPQGSTLDDLCAVVYDIAARKRARVLPRPVFTVSPDGALATSIDFIRLQKVRKGKRFSAPW